MPHRFPRPATAGCTARIWKPYGPQPATGEPAIGKRSFEPGIRAFSFKQINKKNRVNASLSAFYASHCCPYHPEVPINKEFKA